MRHSLLLGGMLALVLVLSSCGHRPEETNISLGKEFSLSTGQSAVITGEDLKIRFVVVSEDSRCARDVVCVWAGRVSGTIDIIHKGVSHTMALTQPGLTDEHSTVTYEDYQLTSWVTPYPEAGKQIAANDYRLHLIVSRSPQVTGLIGSVLAAPRSYEGQTITAVGYYRGWDLLHEANTAPPVTRSDWVIRDSTGALYVNASSEAKIPEGLDPSSREDTEVILAVKGFVRVTAGGQAYIEATSVERE